MKILYYTPTYAPAWEYGGPILFSSQLCEKLVEFGHTVEVITTKAGIKNVISLDKKRNGVKVNYFPFKYFLGIHSKEMEGYLQNNIADFDVLHISGIWQPTSYKACKEALKKKIPYVLSLHGALSPYSWSQKTLKKTIYYLFRERKNFEI